MPRKSNNTLAEVCAESVHNSDVLIGKRGERFYVENVRKARGSVTLQVRQYGDHPLTTWTVAASRLVRVVHEHECQCGGSGVFRGGGVIENGVYKGYQGTCYGCSGKGWQDRTDVIRNHTYWAKYARISA